MPSTAIVNGWTVADASRHEVIDRLVELGLSGRPSLAVDLHVSALSTPEASNRRLARSVDLAYADGVSVVLLARLAGARRVQKTTTTHIAAEVLAGIRRGLDRTIRVALVGGPPGLAEDAARRLEENVDAAVVFTCDGYASDGEWASRLESVRSTCPEVTFVGLGHPLEVEWCVRYRASLPQSLVMTCGGYFGYLAGREHPAPHLVQGLGLEWAWRVAQAPRRLLPRYLKGFCDVITVGARTIRDRVRPTGV